MRKFGPLIMPLEQHIGVNPTSYFHSYQKRILALTWKILAVMATTIEMHDTEGIVCSKKLLLKRHII